MARKPTEDKLDQMPAMREVVSRTPSGGTEVRYFEEDFAIADRQEPEGEPVLVAGLGLRGVRGLAETLKGQRAPAQPTITDAVPEPTGPVTPPPRERVEPTMGETAPAEPVLPVSEERMTEQAAERARMLEAGETAAAPSPTPAQVAAGVEAGPISTIPFDSEGMQATVRSAANAALGETPTMRISDIYEKAIEIGVPEKVAGNIVRGVPLESQVGGSALAENLAGLLKLHDDSASVLDDLFRQLSENRLGVEGQLQLRQQMAYHDLILKQVKGVQVDVARSMNVFKRFDDPSERLSPAEIRSILDQAGGDASLLQMATDYMNMGTRKGRNDILQAGLGKRLRETWMYTYQSNLLTNPDTHAYNAAASIILGSMASVERMVASGWGVARQKLMPSSSAQRYHMEQSLAEMYGFWEGVKDGFQFGAHALRTGQRATMKGDVRVSPISAEKFSNVDVRAGNIAASAADVATSVTAGMPMPVSPVLGGLSDFGRVLYTTPDLSNSWIGKTLDGFGYLHSMSFRMIAGVDEGVGGVVARMNLYSEGWVTANRAYDEAILRGATPTEAQQVAKEVFADLLHTRPANMQANIESARRQATLMDNFHRENAVSEAFWKTDQFFNHPLTKVYVPFGKTMLNLYSEGAARIPGLNITSPRFWDEYNKGGKHRDLALTRVAMGAASLGVMTTLSLDNKITGTGPSDFADRQVLQQLGWQPYSFHFQPGEINEANINSLSQFAQVTRGTGSLEGHVFVSYARLDPLSQLIATGANMGDAMKFHTGRPDDEMVMEMVKAGLFATSEYIAEMPIATSLGDLLTILRTRQEDDGERVVQVLSRFAKQYMDYSFTGTPGVGLANSSFVAKLETFVDPERRSNMADQMDLPAGIRQMEETRQRIMSRIPGVSPGVPLQLDNLGNPIVTRTRGLDNYWNWVPILRVSTGVSQETYERLADINHGVSRPSSVWGGVALSATQYERYKYLYGNGIKLDLGVERRDGSLAGPLSLNEAIPLALDQFIRDSAMAGEIVMIGDQQKFVDTLVSRYRKMAKMKMLGFDPEGTSEADLMDFMENIGMPGGNIEFPELAAAIQKNQDFIRFRGR